ncbi:NEL-type E3 ubiquitin ligase domain-containing protein [Pseudomonas sp. TWI628]|uniref:NEL-type E3 ubiquitin ligase domain-containing protein n=1 Tax=Pseudomonas sp. TWI628 TaxID=3136788 RepID=UPI00320A750D
MAYDVVDGIYEGYADWQLGDRQAALEHVLGAAENAVLVGVGVGVGIAAQRVLKSAKVVSRLVPVPINDSQFRLIHPDLPGYEVLDDSLAAGEPSGEPGHERLRTPAATFEVAKDPLTQQWSVRHPVRPDAYAPMLEHNGAGGWRHEFETPQDWQGRSVLFRRLGSALGDVPEQTIDDVLLATGFDEARLRRLHLENAAAPARLLDALQRYQLHQQAPLLQGQAFELRLSQQQAAPTAAAQVLRNVFPGLTPRGAEEIVGRAPRRLVQSMVEDKKVPLQLAGEARWLLRDSRIDRASAGLRQTAAINADTERLALGLLADIAPWPDTLRVEVRDDRGGVIAKAGADSAGEVRVIQRDGASYRAYDAAGRLLTNDTLGDPLFKALLSQVNDQQRRALGEAAASPAAMAERLSQDAFEQRDRAASLIGLQPLPRGLKPLVRSGDGRLGYPLSGGAGKSLGEEDVAADLEDDEAFPDALEQGVRRLFPARDEATVQMYLRGLSGGANDPWPAYRELVNQVRTLRRSLAVWRGQDAERTRIAQEIFDRWQPVLNGETPAFELDLDGQVPGGLAPLPASVQWGRLTRLTLRSIDLAQFDASLVERLDGLRHLSLVDSAITAVPDWLLNLEQLEGLNLSNNQLAALPAGIARLGRLTELNLAHNRFTQVPVEVGELGQLRVLNLQNNHVVVDGSGRAHLARLHRLEVLALSHNPLGDLGSLPSNIALERISLRFARLTEFPSQLVRQHARLNLSLEGNSISELSPESVRVIQLNRNRINLGYNPLSTRAVSLLQEAASDEHPDLLNGGRVVLQEAPGPSPAAAETPWLSGYEGETLARRREQWQRLQADEGSATLRALLNELAQDPLYNRHPAFIRARVWALLDACELNPGVRQEIFTVAGDAFGDQPLLMLSNLEVRSQIIQSTAGLAGDQVQAALLRMGRSLYRLNEVDRIASNEVGQRQRAGRYVDSVELLLAYRQGLASSLDLPVNVDQMQLPMLADISLEELDLARDEVLDGESDAAVGVSLASRDFWREYLRARHEQQFSDLDNEFAQRLEDLEEQGLDLNQYFALSGALAAERNVRLEQLYLDLTHEAYRNESAPE